MRTLYPLNKVAAISLVALGVFIAIEVLAAQAPRSLWDGVYTQDQAKRGEAIYSAKCARCHGADLVGGDSVPPLSGVEFLSTWNTKTVGDLFERTRISMPADKPKSLTRQEDADVLAYVLSVNKFPAGGKELETQTELLKQIQFDAFK